MYLKSKKIAFLGLLTAMSVLFIVLSGIIEMNTFFLLGLSAFCVGVAIQEAGIKLGGALLVATTLLGLLLAPNKMYCFTYSVLAVYIFCLEVTIQIVNRKIQDDKKRNIVLWIAKYIYFNVLYLPILFFLPKLIYQGEFSTKIYVIAIVGGQVGFYIFDWVYNVVLDYYMTNLRKKLKF